MLTNAAVYLALVQAAVIVLLAVDRWVNRVTGAASLESRVGSLETVIAKASDTFSEKWSKIQTGIITLQITQAQQEQHLKGTDARLEDLNQRVNKLHGIS